MAEIPGWAQVSLVVAGVTTVVAMLWFSVKKAAKVDAKLTADQLTQRDKDDAW